MNAEITHLSSDWLKEAMRHRVPVQVCFSDGALLLIDAESGNYDSDVDLSRGDLLAAKDVLVKPLPGALLGKRAQPLPFLLWTLQLRQLQERMKSRDYEYQANLFTLVSWPCLTHLPEEIIPLTARICALLSYRHSTSALLIPSLLDAPPMQVFPIVEALHMYGHIQVLGEQQAKAVQAAPVRENSEKLATDSFISKIWGRLWSQGPKK